MRGIPLLPAVALAIVVAYVLVAVFGPFFAPFGQNKVAGGTYDPPSAAFLLGTDNLGRDMLSRLIYGARNTMSIAAATTLLSFFIGVTAGFAAAISRPWLDQTMSRVTDVLIAIPKLIFALLVLAVVGTSTTSLILTIALLDATRIFRVARAVAGDVVVLDFVEASQARGEGRLWIMLHDILPNTLTPLLAQFGLQFGFTFLFISTLGFLGIGIQPPAADWGTMVRENATLLTFGSLVPIVPAVAIALLSLCVNFVIDWVLSDSGGLKD